MATITSIQSGNWGTAGTWDSGVPVNGDTVIIAEGHEVIFNVDQSGFANGLLSLTINGRLGFDNASSTCLKMNGNITGTGELIVAMPWECEASWYDDPVEGYPNVHTDNAFSIMDLETLDGVAFTELDSIAEVNETPNSYFTRWEVEQGMPMMYWNQADAICRVFTPINRPTAGSEYKCYLLFNSTGTINVPKIKMYGHCPEREYTQLSADASAGQNQIVLSEDLDLQQGDKIIIGCGGDVGRITETGMGVYTINSYTPATKTAVLTSNLDSNRFDGDYVAKVSRPIKIKRSSGTGAIFQNIDNIDVFGVHFTGEVINNVDFSISEGHRFNHCTFDTAAAFSLTGIYNSQIDNSTVVDTAGYGCLLGAASTCRINDTFLMTEDVYYYDSYFFNLGIMNCIFTGCVGQNINDLLIQSGMDNKSVIFYDSDFKNLGAITWGGGQFYNCTLHGVETQNPGAMVWKTNVGMQEIMMVDCVINADTDVPWFQGIYGKFYNTFFNIPPLTDITLNLIDQLDRPLNSIVESFDHNQIPGNYKAWTKGGTIETDTDLLGDPIPGHLIFTCQSADYPVFRDFPMLLAAYKTNRWQALVNKSFTGGEVKIELIDPTSDPLIDSEATPLASYSLPDQADTNLPLKLGYKSDKAMQAILRISATNSEGTVEVDSRLIENRVQHG